MKIFGSLIICTFVHVFCIKKYSLVTILLMATHQCNIQMLTSDFNHISIITFHDNTDNI